jgi:DNA processing protein
VKDASDRADDPAGASRQAGQSRREDDTLILVALSLLPVWTWRDLGDRLRAGANPGGELDRLLDERSWSRRSRAVSRAELMDRACAVVKRAQTRGLTLTLWGGPWYPPMLAAIVDPPPVLWSQGSIEVLERPAVAVVGSRAATPYALDVAARLAADLARRGVVIVSGLARGVDSAAHRGALSADGPTVAVLGCGADVVYPPEHAALTRAIATTGLVVSELAPGTRPLPQFFPQRNRIISGLSKAVVIVEAGEKSGSLITARCALEQGRDVLAVPGNVLSGRNRGGHALLRDGAKIVEVADDILEELGMCGPNVAARPGAEGRPASLLDPVLEWLPTGEACDLDGISDRSGLSPEQLLPRLLELELDGRVRRVGAGRFVRFDRSC